MLAVLLVVSCAGRSPRTVAREVAKDWTSTRVHDAAQTFLGLMRANELALLAVAGELITDQIEERVDWSYSAPIRLEDNIYGVVVTAATGFEVDLAVLQKSYQLSMSFNLTIDTDEEKLMTWMPDVESLTVEEK